MRRTKLRLKIKMKPKQGRGKKKLNCKGTCHICLEEFDTSVLCFSSECTDATHGICTDCQENEVDRKAKGKSRSNTISSQAEKGSTGSSVRGDPDCPVCQDTCKCMRCSMNGSIADGVLGPHRVPGRTYKGECGDTITLFCAQDYKRLRSWVFSADDVQDMHEQKLKKQRRSQNSSFESQLLLAMELSKQET